MHKVIAIFNQAGGVCKITVAMNLGHHLALRGHRVLLVDADPQASLTTFMGLEPYELEQKITNTILEEDTALPIHHDIHQMDLVPATLSLIESKS